MIEKLQQLEKEYEDLAEKLSGGEVINNPALYKKYSQRLSEITRTVELFRKLKNILKQKQDAEKLLSEEKDEAMIALAKEEMTSAEKEERLLLEKLKIELLPKDPLCEKDCIIEIRAGTGGEEAALFAKDLCRMYMRFAERHRFKVELLSESHSDTGGYKEVIFAIRGKGAYGLMGYESGVHRVQRIPVTEAKGRIHTSTATVAVLPEAEDIDIKIRPEDLRIDTFRAGGKGGQHVQKTESAIRIVHLPTGIEAQCQDERSQAQNKEKALRILKSRILALEKEKQERELREKRISQIGTGERSEKIRTYNYPQDRITDHRIKVSFSNLPVVMDGEIDELLQKLTEEDQARKLREFEV